MSEDSGTSGDLEAVWHLTRALRHRLLWSDWVVVSTCLALSLAGIAVTWAQTWVSEWIDEPLGIGLTVGSFGWGASTLAARTNRRELSEGLEFLLERSSHASGRG